MPDQGGSTLQLGAHDLGSLVPTASKTIPSWRKVARQDDEIAPATERYMAKRAGSHTVEIDASPRRSPHIGGTSPTLIRATSSG